MTDDPLRRGFAGNEGECAEAVLAAPGAFEFRLRHVGELHPDWVRVRFLYCGVCGSDLSKFEGRRSISYPASLGHEFVAKVTQVGARVDTLNPGDVVTSDLNYRCGKCDQCLARRSHLCRQGRVGLFSNYAFADGASLHASYLLRVDGAASAQLALSEPLSCALHAIDSVQPAESDRTLVIGAGGMGLCLAFGLCNRPAPSTFEITDIIPSRLSLLGTAAAAHARPVSAPEGEYEVVFDVSGSADGLRSACDHVKDGGRLCSMSHLDGYSDAAFLLSSLSRRDIAFRMSYLNGERANLEEAARLLASGWIEPWTSTIEIFPLDQLQEAFERRRTASACKTLVEIGASTGEE